MRPYRNLSLLLIAVLWIGGCSDVRQLMPTPNLYASGITEPFSELAPELASTEVELIYVTDRAPETDEAGKLFYGFQRSASLAVGTTVVDLGQDLSWEQLVQASRTHTRVNKYALRLISIDEFARLPPTPTPYRIVGGKAVEDAAAVAARDASVKKLRAEMIRRD